MPAQAVAKQLESLETLPAVCVGAMWAMAVGVLILWIAGTLWALLVPAPALVVWVLAGWLFGKSCDFKYGWLTVLGWFHLAGLCWLAVFAGVAVGAFYIAEWVPARSRFVVYVLYALLIVSAPFIRMRLRSSSRKGIYALAKDKLAALCREIVIAAARRTHSI